ncbi:GntR family transcriptional regulator [Arthrobacter sp. VKM Ac-2550]|uniref:GntR family transcriptional regulator n=1 Tax=Crystallibacter permensis TaxID=1938888 RepID=UPI002226B9DB|nr:GntR family transcriptional regulator [Arthrobacter sp. VKM Ac-2550]
MASGSNGGDFVNGKLALPQSRIELVLESIRQSILTNEFAPGAPLVEAELAERMGVSKTPVREALKILSNTGLVQFVPYKGARVQKVDAEFISAVCDLRLVMEPEAVRRSVEAQSRSSLEQARRVLDEARQAVAAGDRAKLSILNRQFHSLLYQDCGNHLMRDVLDNLRDRTALISVIGWQTAENSESAPSYEIEWGEHMAMLDAAYEANAELARSLVEGHIRRFCERSLHSVSLPLGATLSPAAS